MLNNQRNVRPCVSAFAASPNRTVLELKSTRSASHLILWEVKSIELQAS